MGSTTHKEKELSNTSYSCHVLIVGGTMETFHTK